MSSFCTIFYYKYVSACLMETAIMSVETCKGEMSHFDVRQRGRVPREVWREAFSPAAFLRSRGFCLSDRLLPRYTFPAEGTQFFPLWARTAFGLQTK